MTNSIGTDCKDLEPFDFDGTQPEGKTQMKFL